MIVPGGKVTMFMAILMFGEPGAEILYPDPGFPIYRSMIEFTGATPIPVPIREENGFAFGAEETLGLITPRTRLLILNSPANPTGGVTPKAEIERLVAGLARHPDVAVMSDEIYGTMTYDGEAHVSLLQYPEIRDRLIYLDGASKTYAMTGWRLGWSVWPKPLYDAARKLAVNAHSCVNAATQWAGVAALNGPQDCVREMVAEFDRRRKIVVEGLNRLLRRLLHHPEGRLLRLPERLAHRLEGEGARLDAPRGGRRRDDRRPGFRRPRRGLSAPLLRQLGREHPARARAHGRFPGDAEGGVNHARPPLPEGEAELRRCRDRVRGYAFSGGACGAFCPPAGALTPAPLPFGERGSPRRCRDRVRGYAFPAEPAEPSVRGRRPPPLPLSRSG